jgi:hypothetical protein
MRDSVSFIRHETCANFKKELQHMLEAMVQWKVSTVQRTRLTSNSVKANKRKEKLDKLLAVVVAVPGAGAEDAGMKS